MQVQQQAGVTPLKDQLAALHQVLHMHKLSEPHYKVTAHPLCCCLVQAVSLSSYVHACLPNVHCNGLSWESCEFGSAAPVHGSFS